MSIRSETFDDVHEFLATDPTMEDLLDEASRQLILGELRITSLILGWAKAKAREDAEDSK